MGMALTTAPQAPQYTKKTFNAPSLDRRKCDFPHLEQHGIAMIVSLLSFAAGLPCERV